ncbi:RAS guanyl-releasing protein 1 [Collichthys lucidus]|uniref:RAS guanyl-releasing protein 1 n=1 Tax=Collichthys lucidus TaxID=240159 RepID=A0A4V6ARU7_COLLU|nr:RAS guanyl-releasing protein 1 [Collichthys lucidus]
MAYVDNDITRALQSPSPAPSASAPSLDELIQRCLNCFDKRGLRRAQICHLIRQWIGQFPAVFEADPLLEQIMGDLWALVRSGGEEKHSQLIDTSCLSPGNIFQAPSPSVKKRKVSLIFDHMEPDEMAEHLSYLEFKNFCNVSFLDYRSYVVRGSVRDNPALERSVMMCNGVSQWVQLMILSRHTAQQRAQVFTKFIHVAQDLISLNEALPDYIDEDKINLSKLQHLYSNINDLLALHSYTPPFEANKDLLHLLTLSLDLYYTEDEIYELSYTKEPQEPQDPVHNENYDQNQDGYISLEDFEKIAANFPSISALTKLTGQNTATEIPRLLHARPPPAEDGGAASTQRQEQRAGLSYSHL